jgi:hypothetical protein
MLAPAIETARIWEGLRAIIMMGRFLGKKTLWKSGRGATKSLSPSVVIEHGPSLKSPWAEGPNCTGVLVIAIEGQEHRDDWLRDLAICRKSSQNAYSRLALLRPAMTEEFMIDARAFPGERARRKKTPGPVERFLRVALAA